MTGTMSYRGTLSLNGSIPPLASPIGIDHKGSVYTIHSGSLRWQFAPAGTAQKDSKAIRSWLFRGR